MVNVLTVIPGTSGAGCLLLQNHNPQSHAYKPQSHTCRQGTP